MKTASRARPAPYLLAALALSGCVSSRIAAALTRYGLDPQQSRCVGNRLEASLTLQQVQQLSRAARAYGRSNQGPGRLTAGDLVHLAEQIQDLRIPLEVAKAAAGCRAL